MTGLALVGRSVPHFGTVGRWEGTGDFQGEPRVPDADVALEAWGLSEGAGGPSGQGGRVLVADLQATAGDCKGALWGRAVGGAGAAVFEAKAADEKTKTRALSAFRRLPAYAAMQKEYASQKGLQDPARWEDFESGKPEVRAIALPNGSALVTVSISAGTGCGSFGGTLSAAWRLANGVLTPVKDADGRALVPASAADVDGDGGMDFLFKQAVLRSYGGKYDRWEELIVPFLDCEC